MNENQRNYYAVIPSFILNDVTLSDKSKILYGHISSMTNQIGYCWATNKTLSKIMNCSDKTISRLVSKMVKKGYLKSIIIKKENQIVERQLYLDFSFNNKNADTYPQKCPEPIDKNAYTPMDKNAYTPMDKNVQDNNININNININNKKNKKEINAYSQNENKNKLLTTYQQLNEKDRELNRDVELIYKLYPSRCPNTNTTLPKSSKDKEKIRKFLKSKKYTAFQMLRSINKYIDDKTIYEEFKPQLKYLSTFLNNFPDYPGIPREPWEIEGAIYNYEIGDYQSLKKLEEEKLLNNIK